jgi:hypothetical protein
MFTPAIITTETTCIFGWTFANFLKYVQYESMFADSCVREELSKDFRKMCPNVSAQYKLTMRGTGYNGHRVDRHTVINLMDADGEVPPFDPEVDLVNLSNPTVGDLTNLRNPTDTPETTPDSSGATK